MTEQVVCPAHAYRSHANLFVAFAILILTSAVVGLGVWNVLEQRRTNDLLMQQISLFQQHQSDLQSSAALVAPKTAAMQQLINQAARQPLGQQAYQQAFASIAKAELDTQHQPKLKSPQ